MKKLGIIGGLSWESTIEYYRIINSEVQRRLGGIHSAKIIMTSVDFHEYAERMKSGRWDEIKSMILEESSRVARAGGDAILIATNTMHLFSDDIESLTSKPVIHIADATAEMIQNSGMNKVGLIGTIYSMEKPFYKERLKNKHGIEIVTPEEDERIEINRIIFEELCSGIHKHESKAKIIGIINKLKDQGAESVILGCTELPLIIKSGDLSFPAWDTLTIHAMKAVDFILE